MVQSSPGNAENEGSRLWVKRRLEEGKEERSGQEVKERKGREIRIKREEERSGNEGKRRASRGCEAKM